MDDAPRTAAGWTMILTALARELGEDLPTPRGKEDWRAARDRYAATFPRRRYGTADAWRSTAIPRCASSALLPTHRRLSGAPW